MLILCFYLNSYLTWNKTVSSLTYRNTEHLGYVLEEGSLPGQEVSSLDQVRPRTTAELLPDQGCNGVHNNQPYSVGDDFFLQALQPFNWKESNLNEIKLINVNILPGTCNTFNLTSLKISRVKLLLLKDDPWILISINTCMCLFLSIWLKSLKTVAYQNLKLLRLCSCILLTCRPILDWNKHDNKVIKSVFLNFC